MERILLMTTLLKDSIDNAKIIPDFLGIPLVLSNRKKIWEAAIENGWQEIGWGFFAKAFVRDEVVMKIYTDKAYEAFVHHAIRHPHPCFPIFYNYPIIGDNLDIVYMEKLVSTEHIKSGFFHDYGRQISRLSCNGYFTDPENFDMRSNCEMPLIEAIDQIFTLARLHKYDIDLHKGNTMQRPGQELPVIIDPLFDMKTDTSNIVYEMRKRGE